ncbi:type I secretion system permease/ATPase [Kordiimonas aquimaris]|uniref:type I secretion system permease/ATPase n=1 Tax=Kordiimonas aquimaris TaxID=707591 RepID=UPI0021CDFB95|nr:type I secretion system permease/ATPase [Kordiimonas aquimaris]
MSLLEDFKSSEAEFKRSLRSVGLYSFASSICMLGMPIYLSLVYEMVLVSRSMETLLALTIFGVIILLAFGFFDAVRMHLLGKNSAKFESAVSGQILAGELMRQTDSTTQTIRDVAAIRQIVSTAGFAALFDVPVIPVFMILLFLVHPLLGGIVLVGGGILVVLALTADRKVAPHSDAFMDANIKTHQNLEMFMRSQEIVRAQGMYNEVVREWGVNQGNALTNHLRSFVRMTGYSSASKAARQILQIAVIGGGALLVLSDQATAGVIFGASIIGGRALAPIEQIVGNWRNLKQGMTTYKRLVARLEELSLPDNKTPLPRPKGEISVDRIGYVPAPGATPIIRGISGVIKAGESVAIIGPSGAGKSTFVRLLAGSIEPNAGRILLDGQDIKAWDPTSRGLYVGYMPQQVTFFDATVRENIARLRKNDPPEFAVEAAQLAGVHEMILQLPKGYDTEISSQGYRPSGGQSQLIALARAFYRKPAVVILDEPNASLDSSGEVIFHKALGTAKRLGMTVIMVTQRPSALRFTDKVMVLENGLVTQYDDRDKVVNGGVVGGSQQQVAQQQTKAQAQTASGQQNQTPNVADINISTTKKGA